MEEKVKTKEESIPKTITQTFYIVLYRLEGLGTEWTPASTDYTKDSALSYIRDTKKYGAFKDAEFKLISFDIETKI
jgi:hypothetical protein